MDWEELLAAPGGEEIAEKGPPGGVDMLTHAEVSAELAEGDRSSTEILQQRELTEEAWLKATVFWMTRLAQDATEKGARATLPLVYSEAFTKHQDSLKALPAMRPAEWAALTVEMQQGDASRALAKRNLSQADFARLNRHFAKLLPKDPLANDEFLKAYGALQDSGE